METSTETPKTTYSAIDLDIKKYVGSKVNAKNYGETFGESMENVDLKKDQHGLRKL